MKIRLTNPTFSAAAKTVTHASFSDVTLAGIQLIINVTDQIIIYNFADETKGGTLSTDTLTLEYDTTTMSDTDELMVLVEDGLNSQPVVVSSALPAGNNNIGDVDVASLPALPAGNNNIGDVDVASSALPTGASTSANQTTIIGHLDGVEGLLGTIDADTGTIAGAVSGTEMQVDVVGALPAGTNNIGDVDVLSLPALPAGNNNIGDVDVASLPATPAGTNAIGKLLPPNIDITGHTNYAKKYYTNAGAVTDGIIWSPAAGTRWHITSLYIQVSAAATITLEDDLAGGDSPIWKSEFTANQGVYMTFDPMYPWASGEDAADLIITTTAGNVYVTVVGYEI